MNGHYKADQAVILAFQKARWDRQKSWVSYDAISLVVTRDIDLTFKRRTIERCCRNLARKGILESDKKGNFRWRS